MLEEAERLAKRWKISRALAEERRTRAQDFARKLARDLGYADPSVCAILGFGSTFETWRQYREDSDIDLAISLWIEDWMAILPANSEDGWIE